MKVIKTIEFESGDVAVDTNWQSVAIRRYTGIGETGYQWMVTPSQLGSDPHSWVLRFYSDAVMSSLILDGTFAFVDNYHGLCKNAVKVA